MRHLTTRMLRPVAVLAAGAVIATTLSAPAAAAARQGRARRPRRSLARAPAHRWAGLQRPVRLRRLRADRRRRHRTRRHRRPSRHRVRRSPTRSAAQRRQLDHRRRHSATRRHLRRLGRQSGRAGPVGRSATPAASAASTWCSGSRRGSATPRRTPAGSRTGASDDYANIDRPGVRGRRTGRCRLAEGSAGADVPARAAVLRRLLPPQLHPEGQPPPGLRRAAATAAAPDTDVTALAVVALDALPKQTKRVRTAVDNGDRLAGRHPEATNGSFGGGPSTETQQHQQHRPRCLGTRARSARAARPRSGARGCAASRSAATSPARRSPARRVRSPTTGPQSGRGDGGHHRRDPRPVAPGRRPGRTRPASSAPAPTAGDAVPSSAWSPRPSWSRRRGSASCGAHRPRGCVLEQ